MRRRPERGKPFINDHGNATSRRSSPILGKHRALMKSYEKNTTNEKKLDFEVVRDHVLVSLQGEVYKSSDESKCPIEFLVCFVGDYKVLKTSRARPHNSRRVELTSGNDKLKFIGHFQPARRRGGFALVSLARASDALSFWAN